MADHCINHDKMVEAVGEVKGDVRELRVEFVHLAKSIADLAASQAVFVTEFRSAVSSLNTLVTSVNSQREEHWFSLGKAVLVAVTAIITAFITKPELLLCFFK